jgi:glycine cleavage system T protein (aminomethyltransferase)
VQYSSGVLKEHLFCRQSAGLFDVSHMGQAELTGPDFETVARALETLVPAAIVALRPGRQRYTQLLTEDGGIIDDLMVARAPRGDGRLTIVVNAARKAVDYAHIGARLPVGVSLRQNDDLALIALQGPAAEAVLSALDPAAAEMAFMDVAALDLGGLEAVVSRSGYTGEDGYEISLPAGDALALWRRLGADERVRPVGLGARDSLRLEAGLCLYGADISTLTTPVEANLSWSIQKRRREEGGFPGASLIQRELEHGPLRLRVGLLPDGPAPVRAGTPLFATETAEGAVGYVTSGSLGPSLGRPVAMGYVAATAAAEGTALFAELRGRRLPVAVAPMPFVPARFKRQLPS